MNQVKTHPVNHSIGWNFNSNLQNFCRSKNLDISKLASARSLFFSQCIKNILKLVLSNFHDNQTNLTCTQYLEDKKEFNSLWVKKTLQKPKNSFKLCMWDQACPDWHGFFFRFSGPICGWNNWYGGWYLCKPWWHDGDWLYSSLEAKGLEFKSRCDLVFFFSPMWHQNSVCEFSQTARCGPCAWSVLGQMNFFIHLHKDQARAHPVDHTSWPDLTQNLGKNSNLDILRLPSPGSLIFSHYIRYSIKLVQIGMDFFLQVQWTNLQLE